MIAHVQRYWTLHAAWILGLMAAVWPGLSNFIGQNPKATLFVAIGGMILAHFSPSPASSSAPVPTRGTETGQAGRARLAAVYFLLVCLAIGALGALVGCKKTVVSGVPANVPASAVANWYSMANSLDALTKAADSGLKITEDLHAAGIVGDGPIYAGMLDGFGKIFQTSQIAKNALDKIPAQQFTTASAAGFAGYLTDVTNAVNQLNQLGVTGLKDPNSQQTVGAIMANITSAAIVIQALVNGGF